ncbi:MAG: RNA polymerase sigma factor [Candidatus Sedimenticola sp. 6PFRAG1]
MSTECHNDLSALLPRLRRFAYGLTGAMESADDLVQEACERALRNPGKWEEANYLDRWMFRAIRNLHVDQLRHQQVVDRHSANEQYLSPGSLDGEKAFENLVTLEEVEKAIGLLSEEQKAPLLLVTVEGFSYKETAEILDLPIGTVTSRLARARGQMLEIMSSGRSDSGTREVVDG